MGKIVLLDDLTINKIAAGEVVERPASVVKELVENSIDAGANNITVEIKNGGISYIRVTDDGSGIQKDDLEIAFERHATSKIRQADDLEVVKTMGFRGEALASIAAIANVELVSKTREANYGYKVVVEAGDILEKEETGAQNGTTITVKNLFFNTPVRYKFLKKDYTESGYIEDVIIREALVNPKISFHLINSGKTIVKTSGDGGIKNCIYSIYGKDIANNIIDVDYIYEDIMVQGVIGKPAISRNNRTQQMFFVNNRYVKDKTLSSAIEQAYKGMLTIGKHAFCILNIKMEPSQVDVNVHPAKLEVRFNDENKIFKAIYNAIKQNLLKADLVRDSAIKPEYKEEIKPEIQVREKTINYDYKEPAKNTEFSGLFKRNIRKDNRGFNNEPMSLVEQLYYEKNKDKYEKKSFEHEKVEGTKEVKVDNADASKNIIEEILKQNEEKLNKEKNIETEKEDNKSENTNNIIEDIYNNKQKEINTQGYNKEDNKYFMDMYKQTFGKNLEENKKEEEKTHNEVPEIKDINLAKQKNMSVFDNNELLKNKINYKFIGIVFSTYIILEIENEMYILDQHAAHERIMYEKIKKNFYSDEAKDCQLMLLPDIITLTHKEMDIARENYEMFEKAGFELEEFGDNTIKLTGVPNMCMDLDTKELFMEILDAIDTVAITAIQEKEEKFIATIACKSAVKANMALSREEVDALMSELLKLPNPFTCPHGRPTAIRMSKIEIEKKFSRR